MKYVCTNNQNTNTQIMEKRNILFGDLNPGDVFRRWRFERLAIYLRLDTDKNKQPFNAVCLHNGELVKFSDDTMVSLYNGITEFNDNDFASHWNIINRSNIDDR